MKALDLAGKTIKVKILQYHIDTADCLLADYSVIQRSRVCPGWQAITEQHPLEDAIWSVGVGSVCAVSSRGAPVTVLYGESRGLFDFVKAYDDDVAAEPCEFEITFEQRYGNL